MAKTLEITKEHDSRIGDSATGKPCRTEKVVDITEDCLKAVVKERVVLLFTRAKRGRIVQLTRPYETEVYMGTHIFFFVDELDCEMHAAPRDDTFGSWAADLGLTKTALRSFIESHAPA